MPAAPGRSMRLFLGLSLLIACIHAQTLPSQLVIQGQLHSSGTDTTYSTLCESGSWCGTQAVLPVNGAGGLLATSNQYLYISGQSALTGSLPLTSNSFMALRNLSPGGINKMYTTSNGNMLIVLTPTAAHVFDSSSTLPSWTGSVSSTGVQWIAGAFDETETRFWVLGVDASGQNAEIAWVTFSPILTVSRPVANVYLASNNVCRSVTLRRGVGSIQSKMVFGCTGTVAVVSTNAAIGTSFNLNSVSIIPVGAGIYTSATYHSGTDTVFLGADIGLGLACNGSDFNIKALFFISSGIDSSGLVSVFLDESASSPVLFWGASTGMVHRTLFPNEYTLELSEEVLLSNYTRITSIVQHPVDSDMLLVSGAAKPGLLGASSAIWTVTKSLCSTHGNNCEACSKDPYCGYCYGTGACNSRTGCGAALWSRAAAPQVCMNSLTLTPASVPMDGGTTMRLSGNYFNVSEKDRYRCRFYLIGGGAYANLGLDDIGNDFVTCRSPQQILTGTANVDVYWGSTGRINGAPAPPNYEVYKCENRSCDSCHTRLTPECGWCFSDRDCKSTTTCTSATGSPNPAFAFNQGTCPEVSAVSPVSASVMHSRAVTLTVSGFPNHNDQGFYCKFGSGDPILASSVTPSPDGTSISSVTCNSPLTAISGPDGRENVIIDVVTNTSAPWTGQQRKSFERYDCPGFTQCGACNSLIHQDCTWCGDSNTCVYESAQPGTCAASANQCPVINSVSPLSALLGSHLNRPLTLNTANIVDPGANSFTCEFRLGSVALSTLAEFQSATQTLCQTPTDASFDLGPWSLHLALDGRQLMDAHEFLVYECTNRSCASCVDPRQTACFWCASPSLLGCSSVDNGCTSPLNSGSNAAQSCPVVSGVQPLSVAYNSPVDIVFVGNFTFLQSGDVSGLHCGFGTGLDASSREFGTDATIAPDQLSASCEDVLPDAFGAKTAYLYGWQDRLFGEAYTLTVASCEDASNCSACLAIDGCHFCAGACTSNCSVTVHDQLSCPEVHQVTPDFIDLFGDTFVYITGDGFLPLALDGAEPGRRKRESLDYLCHWLPTALAFTATNVTDTFIQCSTPQVSSAMTLNLQISLNNHTYAISPPIEAFQCPQFTGDTCTDMCQQAQHCGWCVGSGNCGGAERCEDGLWLPSCLTTTLSSNTAALEGNLEIVFTLVGNSLPTNFSDTDFACRFGTNLIPISSVMVDSQGHLTGASCIAPPSTQDYPNDVELSLLYRGNKVAETHTFSYVDCGSVKECDRCIATPNCGWCVEGAKRCSAAYQCTSEKNWSNKKCPLNKIAIGVGVGVGLFALILILLLVLFLIRRARRKSGLVIQLREPDYDAIAWGADIDLLYRVPDDKYAVLNSRLARKDYLLQLALALKCPATEQDALAKALVYVACAHDVAPEMIKTVIRAEVRACLEENTLFRSNSVASKMYKFYSRIVGIKYLYHCIARVVLELEVLGKQQEQAIENPKKAKGDDNEVSLLAVSMELDTEKDITDDVDTDTNLLQLQLICQKILTVLIKTSVKNIPSPLRQIFVEIDQSVTSKFPGSLEAVYKGLGGLFFLRFVCPAITAPHVYGLLPNPPNTTTQRQLVLITKVIQSIANMQPPGKKEQYMEVMGSFIETSIPRIKKFYDHLREAANINTHTDIYEREIIVPDEVLLNGLAATQTILVNEAQKVKAWAAESWLDVTSQQDLVNIVDECLEAHGSAPKKMKKQANSTKQGGKKKS